MENTATSVVYILQQPVAYEGAHDLGIYDSYELAEEARMVHEAEKSDSERRYGYGAEIVTVPLNQPINQ